MKRLQESQEARDLFMQYYLMKTRSYRVLVEDSGISLSTVCKWSKEFDWAGRMQEMDQKANERMMEQASVAVVEMNARQIEMAKKLQERGEKFVEDKEGSFRDGIQAIDTGVKIERLAQGEATERHGEAGISLTDLQGIFGNEDERAKEIKVTAKQLEVEVKDASPQSDESVL